MQEVIDDLKVALPALFESEDYRARRTAIDQAFRAKQGDAFVGGGSLVAQFGVASLSFGANREVLSGTPG